MFLSHLIAKKANVSLFEDVTLCKKEKIRFMLFSSGNAIYIHPGRLIL